MQVIAVVALLLACVHGFTMPRSGMQARQRVIMSTATGGTQLTNAPSSFLECVRLSVAASKVALEKGQKLLEVEFPPLPLDFMEDSSSSARDIADANTRWAIEFARLMSPTVGQVTILYPDDAELKDAIRYVETGDNPLKGTNPFPGVQLATARLDSIGNAQSLDKIIASIFGATFAGEVAGIPGTNLYVVVISSTQELPDIEKLHSLSPEVPIVFFNLRLDVLRGDLGLPLFPPRELHYRFLSKILPVYLMRSRSFATSLRRPPFIVNYSGLLFRKYPEPYQSILNTGGGKSKLVKTSSDRPTNMGFREALTDGLYIPNVPQEELKAPGNLVWWEKDEEKELFTSWRL